MCPANTVMQNTDPDKPTSDVTLPAATVTDNSETPLTVTTNPAGSPVVLGIGTQTVTYTVTDDSGNSEMCNLTVVIQG